MSGSVRSHGSPNPRRIPPKDAVCRSRRAHGRPRCPRRRTHPFWGRSHALIARSRLRRAGFKGCPKTKGMISGVEISGYLIQDFGPSVFFLGVGDTMLTIFSTDFVGGVARDILGLRLIDVNWWGWHGAMIVTLDMLGRALANAPSRANNTLPGRQTLRVVANDAISDAAGVGCGYHRDDILTLALGMPGYKYMPIYETWSRDDVLHAGYTMCRCAHSHSALFALAFAASLRRPLLIGVIFGFAFSISWVSLASDYNISSTSLPPRFTPTYTVQWMPHPPDADADTRCLPAPYHITSRSFLQAAPLGYMRMDTGFSQWGLGRGTRTGMETAGEDWDVGCEPVLETTGEEEPRFDTRSGISSAEEMGAAPSLVVDGDGAAYICPPPSTLPHPPRHRHLPAYRLRRHGSACAYSPAPVVSAPYIELIIAGFITLGPCACERGSGSVGQAEDTGRGNGRRLLYGLVNSESEWGGVARLRTSPTMDGPRLARCRPADSSAVKRTIRTLGSCVRGLLPTAIPERQRVRAATAPCTVVAPRSSKYGWPAQMRVGWERRHERHGGGHGDGQAYADSSSVAAVRADGSGEILGSCDVFYRRRHRWPLPRRSRPSSVDRIQLHIALLGP
ncbi:hypothetical protein C8R45DRAFT_939775 [Mycena sanguinolenta]|nr:hypothetical protein C8R45DRAFT_939775 [Mycena sanguinolenta]